MKLSPNEVAYLAAKHWHTPDEQAIAVAIAFAESGGDTEAMGRSTIVVDDKPAFENVDHGLMQVSNKWHQLRGDGTPGRLLRAGATWRDPAVSMAMAREIYDEFTRSGRDPWAAWHVYTSGAHEKYLPMARLAVRAPWAPPTTPPAPEALDIAAETVALIATRLDA